MRSFGVSQKSVSNDRNSDQDDNDDDNNKNNSADQILRNMGGFVPFFATQSSQPQPSPESDTSKSAFWGVSEWFRRDTQNKTNDTTSSKKIEAKSIKKSKVETTTTNRLEAPLPLSKLQDLFSFNSTKSPDKKDNAMLSTRSNGGKNNRGNSTTSTGNYNPLSVFQKFFATPLFQSTTISEEETWYPVFPKTRIMPGEMVPVSVMGIDLLVIASIDGRSLYCIANSCPHLGTPLETGRLTRLPIESQSISSISSLSSIPTTDSLLTAAATTSATPNDNNNNNNNNNGIIFTETDIANILSQDGCEDCIICPLHRTAFALTSGEVRGEWCPYPPIIGALMGTVKEPTSAAVFQVRTRGKNIEVRLNSVLPPVRESS